MIACRNRDVQDPTYVRCERKTRRKTRGEGWKRPRKDPEGRKRQCTIASMRSGATLLRRLPARKAAGGRKPPASTMKEGSMFETASLSALPSFCIGHAEDAQAGTGCTVVIAPRGAACGVDVRGGGPATRETDLLKPENMIQDVHAVVLSGGSAFGLEASCGVMETLACRDIGFPLGQARVPIVVGACLFDLLVGKPIHPDKAMGRAAAEAALAQMDESCRAAETERKDDLAQGNVGAGCGATVGKIAEPERAMKSGLGWACLRAKDVVAAALVAVNALGCVRDESGTWISGVRDEAGGVMDPLAAIEHAATKAETQGTAGAGPCENTTIGVVITNAKLTKAQATKVSSTVHDAYARAIKPVHTANDGDTVFTFASREVDAPYDLVAVLATEAMQKAIVSAVKSAAGAFGLPAARDLDLR